MKPTAIGLFACIGSIRLEFKRAGFDIVRANEYDAVACKTYRHNFGSECLVKADIRSICMNDIPDFDVLTAGFPCQPFSISGRQKGFGDKRGDLFFEITYIIDAKRPKVIFLGNEPNLMEHENGKTFLVTFNSLAQFGYSMHYRVMESNEYGNLPQIQKRIYIVAVREDIADRIYQPPNPSNLRSLPQTSYIAVASKTIFTTIGNAFGQSSRGVG